MTDASKEIVLIAPNDDLFGKAKALLNREARFSCIDVVLGDLDAGVRLAQKKVDQGAKIIISRGGTYDHLKEALSVPVVEIRISVNDLLASYSELAMLDEPLAVVGYSNIVAGFDLIRVFRKQVKQVKLTHDSDVSAVIDGCVQDGIRVFAGDTVVSNICKARNLPCYLWTSSEFSVAEACETAIGILEVSKEELEQMNRCLAIIDYTHDAVIATNEHNQIVMMNAPAEHILGISKGDYLGRDLASLSAVDPVFKEIKDGAQIVESVREINGQNISLSDIPIMVHEQVRGVVIIFQQVAQLQQLEHKVRLQLSKKGFIAKHSFSAIIYRSRKMQECISVAKKFAQYDGAVLIEGETGTGKELFAQGIHNASHRHNGPFVAINCAALPPTLIESELFGYVEGAFTGTRKGGKAGMFEMAHHGTLFLDEIAELPLELQGRLLRVIQEKEVVRLGDDKVIPLDIRLICATNQNIRQMMVDGRFRRDLFYRISILNFQLTPLDARRDDIPLLADAFLRRYAAEYGKEILGFSPDAMCFLCSFHYRGNVRELRGMVERAVVICETSQIDLSDIRYGLDSSLDLGNGSELSQLPQLTLGELERQYMHQVLNECLGSAVEACKILGISRTTLWRHLKDDTK